ncbi:MAG: tetratricopeptide repeat protein, partial [Deltaproteobacteria bacterium]|nr:tetratricopeptide repeat protein [Deltaproteobacteria bacterium]
RIGRLLAQAKQGGKYDEMQKEIDNILALPADRMAPSEKAFAEYAAAEIALARGDRTRAAQLTEAALRRDPRDPRLHFLKGQILYLDNKLDEAITSWAEARRLDPFAGIYYFEVAEALREAKRPIEAVQIVREYGDKNYKSDKYKVELGIALADKGDFVEAEQIFKQMLEYNEYDADALFGLGYTYELQKKWEEARTQYGTADQVRRGWADPWFRMGYLTIEGEKDYPTAREYFEKALEKYIRANAPKRKLAKCYLGIAQAWELEKKPKEAAKAKETADELLK